jgi:hypothetical protein
MQHERLLINSFVVKGRKERYTNLIATDMKTLPLLEATEKLFGSDIAHFLSCIPGKLAYFEGEEAYSRFLLKF